MELKLYPIKTIRTQQFEQDLADELAEYSQSPIYLVYQNYANGLTGTYDVSIASEVENENTAIVIDDPRFYECFETTKALRADTLKYIRQRSQQGLLKRGFWLDFEKHHSDGKIEIFISIMPHC
ncbi:hypothetical protein A4G18_09710 [Pasteurellaceae bacterium Pebbles2]|nr:hypothetical protein [Pasteurellaceae bacterium Pebbles2]